MASFSKFSCFRPKGALLPECFSIVIASLFRGSISGNNWKKKEVMRKRRGRKICSLSKVAPQESVQMNRRGYIRNFFLMCVAREGGGGGDQKRANVRQMQSGGGKQA